MGLETGFQGRVVWRAEFHGRDDLAPTGGWGFANLPTFKQNVLDSHKFVRLSAQPVPQRPRDYQTIRPLDH